MIRQPISKKRYVLLTVLSVVLIIAGYTALSSHQHAKNPNDRTLPSWSQMGEGVAKSMIYADPKYENRRWIVMDMKASLTRLLIGVSLGILIGAFIGLYMGCFQEVEALFHLPMAAFAAIPATAALTVFMALAGTDELFYVTVIVFGVAPPLSRAVAFAARKDVPDELIHKAYTLGCSKLEAVWSVTLPTIMPKIMESVSIQTGLALVYLMAAEVMMSDVGLGFRVRLESKKLDMSVVYPYLAVIAILAVVVVTLLRELKRFISPWYEGKGVIRTVAERMFNRAQARRAHSRLEGGSHA